MRYAVIAAGEGSRLSQEGVAVPKPLVEVGDERLIGRLLRIFMDCGATDICVVTNSQHPETSVYLEQCRRTGVPLHYVVRTTPSSMHSFYELQPLLDDGEPFILTTVDTVFREQEFHEYVAAWQQLASSGAADGLMGVTDYIDDERPLYVRVDDGMTVSAFLDADASPHYISGGIYGLTPAAFGILRSCIEKGESRMRNFQRALLADGQLLKAWPFSKVLDIDHADDIRKAEEFLRR